MHQAVMSIPNYGRLGSSPESIHLLILTVNQAAAKCYLEQSDTIDTIDRHLVVSSTMTCHPIRFSDHNCDVLSQS